MKSKLDTIIGFYGETAQKQMAIEEMSELTKEICKDFRGNGNKKAITEEIADVSVMLDQLRIIYDIRSSDINDVISKKIKRTWRIVSEKQTD